MATATETKHTPGPWEIDNSTSSQGHDIYSSGQDELLASVYPMKRDGIHNSWQGNARLIAAAPELLQALENSLIFIDYLCEISTLRNKQVRMMAGYHNIESAIKLAKGE